MKSYTRILIVVGVVVLAALGAWYWSSRPAADGPAIPALDLAPLASVSPMVLSYDTAPSDWKTYASASAGFKVSYPVDWTVGPCAPGCVGWAPPSATAGQLALGVIISTTTMDELLKSAEPFLAAKEEVKAGANTWLKLTLRQPTTGDIITSHFVARGGKLYEFGTATADDDILAVYGKMIRSFVFTK